MAALYVYLTCAHREEFDEVHLLIPPDGERLVQVLLERGSLGYIFSEITLFK